MDIVEYMDQNSQKTIEALRELEKTNEKIENLICWQIKSDHDLKKLIARLFVQNKSNFNFSDTQEVNKIKNTIDKIIEKYGYSKMICIKESQNILNVKFDLSNYPKT